MGQSLSPDGKKLCAAIGSQFDRGGKVWDLDSGAEIISWKATTVDSVAWSGDGKWIASSENNTVVLRKSANGDVYKTLGLSLASRIAITHDGRKVAAAGSDGVTRVWDVASEKLIASYDQGSGRGCVAFSPDGQRLAASADGVVQIFDLTAKLPTQPETVVLPKTTAPALPLDLPPHTGSTPALGFSPDGTRVVTGDTKVARVWDAKSGKELFKLDAPGSQFRAAFSTTGRMLTLSNSESGIRLWDAATGKPLPALPALKGAVREAVFTPDGKRVVCADATGAISVFDLATGKQISSVAAFDPKLFLNGYAISPDGSKVCYGLGKSPDWAVTIWDVEKSKIVLSTPAQEKAIWSVAWSGDGQWIVSGGVDQIVTVWNADNGKLHKTLTGPEKTVARVAITRDGGRVAANCFDGVVRVWDVGKGKVVESFQFDNPGTGNVAFTPDEQRMAGSAPGVVRIWELP